MKTEPDDKIHVDQKNEEDVMMNRARPCVEMKVSDESVAELSSIE